jgi:RHS repeat-associated protein
MVLMLTWCAFFLGTRITAWGNEWTEWSDLHRQAVGSIPADILALSHCVAMSNEIPVETAIAEMQSLQVKTESIEDLPDLVEGELRSPGKRSRNFAELRDLDPWQSALFSNEPHGGPLSEINLSSREVSLNRTDMTLPSRGGLGFEFRRTYRSYWRYAGPLGAGWDHNHNQRLVMDASDPDNAETTDWYTGSGCTAFRRDGDGWKPPDGSFASLNPGEKETVITTRSGLRMVFERAYERPVSGSYWRLVRVTTRHHRENGEYANVMSYRYQAGSDRLLEVTDAFSVSVRFGYDSLGRVTEVRCQQRSVRFSYDPDDNLVNVTYPAVALSLNTARDLVEEYGYLSDNAGGHYLAQYCPLGARLKYSYEYETRVGAAPRGILAVQAVGTTGITLAHWTVSAEDNPKGRTVVYRPPIPSPEERYAFDSKAENGRPSAVELRLPVSFSIRGRGASWRYIYNQDGLLTEIVHPSGRRSLNSYQENHRDSLMRANLLVRRELPAGDATATLSEMGDVQEYHPSLPFPVAVRSYEVTAGGVTNILETTAFRYNEYGDQVYESAGGVQTWTLYTPYGEPAIRIDGIGVATCWKRFERFIDGRVSVQGGGLLAQEILDVDPTVAMLEARFAGITVPDDIPGRNLPVEPLVRTTKYEYDHSGQLARENHPEHCLLYLNNKLGMVLGTYDMRADLALEFFDSSLNVTSRASRLSWMPVADSYAGEMIAGGQGRFRVETFDRDERGLITRWERSHEQFNGHRPEVRYLRHPNGTVYRRQAQGEPALMTLVDPVTGFVTNRHLEAEGQAPLPLLSQIAYDAEGNLLEYADDRGLRHTFRTDPFGRTFQHITPDGVVWESSEDGADRVVGRRVLDAEGRELDGTRYTYNRWGGLLLSERHLLERDEAEAVSVDKWLTQESNHYDAAGRVASNRTVHVDSGVAMSYDGLGRLRERHLPGGDRELRVYAGDLVIADVREWRNTEDYRSSSLATLRFYNERQQPWLEVPCPAGGPPAFSRAQVSQYDTQGRAVMSAQPEQAIRQVHYNSLDQVWRTESRPAIQTAGDNVILVTIAFDAAGRTVSTAMANKPLALIITAKPKTELATRWDVPQVRRFDYDSFGRLVTEVDPDGLESRRAYTDGSLVHELRRSRAGAVESVELNYDFARRVTAVRTNGREIQSFTYDPLGHLVQAVDRGNTNHLITVSRRFNSMGDLLSERISTADDGAGPPALAWAHDPAHGVTITEIVNGPVDPSFWHRKTTRADGQGRVRSLDLDETPGFVRYEYDGAQVVRRDLPAAGLVRKAEFTLFRELRSELWETATTAVPETFAVFQYYHDDIGRLEADDFSLPMPAQAMARTHLHAYDAFGRLRKQGRLNRLFGEREDRMRALTASPAQYLKAGRTQCFDYDEAGNRTREYGLAQTPKARESAPDLNPEGFVSLTLLSPAKPFKVPTAIEGERTARASPDMKSGRLGSTLAVDVAGRLLRTYDYDPFGRMRKFESRRNGQDLVWEVEYDPLGRTIRMRGIDLKTNILTLDLSFASDVFGRRVLKNVREQIGTETANTTEITAYEGTLPLWVRRSSSGSVHQWQQYLWGPGERETVFAVLPRSRVEIGRDNELRRYFLHQNRQLDVFASTVLQNGRVEAFDLADYSGFGESATYAQIAGVKTIGLGIEQDSPAEKCRDHLLDLHATHWNILQEGGGTKALLLTLSHQSKLDELTVWCDSFPKDFRVFVLSDDVPLVDLPNFVQTCRRRSMGDTNVAAWVVDGANALLPGGRRRDARPDDPYRLRLGNREGRHILILWDEETAAVVREFEVRTTPRPASSLAFASAWRDDETGLYYQGARYRLPEMGGKFISPDPLGFVAGHNLYAYANNDPLTYYDPDGEVPHVLVGAGIGALIGGGSYALQVLIIGEEWDTRKFLIRTGSGALAGAAFALVGPLAYNPATAGTILEATVLKGLSLVPAGVTAGYLGAGSDRLFTGRCIVKESWRDAAIAANREGLKGAAMGGATAFAFEAVQGGVQFARANPKVGGYRVTKHDDLIDPSRIDARGRTNLERMNRGLASVGPDGKSLHIHHTNQRPYGRLEEMTQTVHQQDYSQLHHYKGPSRIDRASFDRWREDDYWPMRARDFGGY